MAAPSPSAVAAVWVGRGQQGRLLSPSSPPEVAGPPGPALGAAGRELWETGRLPPCSAGKSCLRCPCPEGCLPRRSRHRASLVLASSSAYKRFSELLPKERRENACSARVPKSQILTLPELRVRCLADSGTRCCSLGPGVFGQGPVYLPRCRCSALDCCSDSHLGKLFTYRTSAVPTNSFLVPAVPQRIPEIPAARSCCPGEAQDRHGRAVCDGPAAEWGTCSCTGLAPACGRCLPRGSRPGTAQPCPEPFLCWQANPFQHRICRVFSTSDDGDDSMSFEDFLDMLSVFSDSATSDIKSHYAFRIFGKAGGGCCVLGSPHLGGRRDESVFRRAGSALGAPTGMGALGTPCWRTAGLA